MKSTYVCVLSLMWLCSFATCNKLRMYDSNATADNTVDCRSTYSSFQLCQGYLFARV